MLATKTAMITPAIAPNEARGSSVSRREASSIEAPPGSAWSARPTKYVSHGPTRTIPTITPANAVPTRIKARSWDRRSRKIEAGRTTSETTSGMARRALGIPGVCRRWTPSGVTTTRRRATTEAATPTTGITSSNPTAGTSGGTIEPGNHVAASSGILATRGRVRKNRPIPATTPMTVTNKASTAASRVICEAVAPTSRRAASRCSRRAADSRVAVETKTATGTSAPMTARMIISTAISGRSGAFGVGSNAVIGAAPNASSASGSRPMTATSSSGDRRPTSPMVPTTVPIRSPSWSAGTVPMSAASAGETTASPGPGTRSTPGGVGGVSVSPATRTRTSGSPR